MFRLEQFGSPGLSRVQGSLNTHMKGCYGLPQQRRLEGSIKCKRGLNTCLARSRIGSNCNPFAGILYMLGNV